MHLSISLISIRDSFSGENVISSILDSILYQDYHL